MTKIELNRFRAVLTARVAELDRFIRNRDGITVERSADQLDEIQAASQRALAVCNLDREFNHLRDAQAALRRIEEGGFGTCQECDEDIHPKRLAAVPWAPYCIHCQENIDGNVEEMRAPSRRGDCIRVSHEDGSTGLLFGREPEGVPAWGVSNRAA
jgi:DnaK suppressor protein